MFISETGENSGKNKAARESKILYRDFPEIAERSRYVADIRDHINNISFTIEVMNNYQDRDIAAVVNYMKALADSEKKLLEALKEQLKQVKKSNKGTADAAFTQIAQI